MDFSCSGLLTGAISCKASTKLRSKLWCLSAEQGKGCAWHRRTHFMLLIRSRALVTEEGAGSSNGNSATGPASTPVWNHWALSADRFPWSDMLWSDSFAQQSPGWLQHTLYAHCTCEQALLQTACHVWLLHYCGCHRYEWIPTPSFFLRSSDKIHLSEVTPLMKVCGKVCRHPWTKLIHTECKMCRSLHLNSNLFNCVYSNWIFIFQQVPCSLQRDQ